MQVPLSDHTIKVFKPIKTGRSSEYSKEPSAEFTANIQQASFAEVAEGLNSNPTGREWTIRGNTLDTVKQGDKLIDENGVIYIAKYVVPYKNGYLDYIQILGVQDGI